jgi:hypothetical protein
MIAAAGTPASWSLASRSANATGDGRVAAGGAAEVAAGGRFGRPLPSDTEGDVGAWLGSQFAGLRRRRCDSTHRGHGPEYPSVGSAAPGAGTSGIFFSVTTFMTLFLF